MNTPNTTPIALDDRLELFVDHHLIDQLEGARLEIGRPQPKEVALCFDQPWEKSANYVTVLEDAGAYHMYYRGCAIRPDGEFDNSSEVTCYAESRDGIHWTKPLLGLHEFRGSRDNNIILPPHSNRISSNFAPFIDRQPGVPDSERFKAVGGVFNDNSEHVPEVADAARAGGLIRLGSEDGVHWRILFEEPVFAGYALDTLNCVTWVDSENNYAIYLRTWTEGGTPDQPAYRGHRTVSRSVSKDFITWSKPEPMTFGHAPPEDIYTNGTHPYFRAPHLLIGLGFRFRPDRRVLSEGEMTRFGVHHTQRRGVSDAILLTSRGGNRYDRTFMESFIRPGPDRESWSARNNAPALGIVPTGAGEMSMYLVSRYTQPDSHLRRFVLRTDALGSLHAPYAGSSMATRPLTFTGGRLVLNYATSAAGCIRVEILDESLHPLPGFAAANCDELVGDEIERTVSWRGHPDVSPLAGKPVRLRFIMSDADLFALRFRS